MDLAALSLRLITKTEQTLRKGHMADVTMQRNYRLCQRGGLSGEGGSLPFLRVERKMTLPTVLHLASVLSGGLIGPFWRDGLHGAGGFP
ncbi:hypothetical protein E1286_17200 [Nonomuraea terrae]|uniref:Uncharacterized protein n=1 Tax=Nonomuraea terrae TaxID=2530383 RepID=A0A4R4YTD7_9ACTN|nr:hypothetical protein [Nonomuraea terrae]TDD47519.1 hypothetical protein E1286_17200 [Nonomuraea terrae]